MESTYDTNEDQDRIFQIFSQLKKEYKGQAFNNYKKLKLLNLSVDSLPTNLCDSLRVCTTLSQALGLEVINKHTLMIKNTELLMKGHRNHEMQCESKLNGIKVKNILKDVEQQTVLTKRMCEKLFDDNENMMDQCEKKAASVAFLEEKLKSYHEQVKKLDVTIAEIEPNFEFKEIVDCDEQIRYMDDEIRHLQSKLDKYRNLPPNMILAEEKLKEEKLILKKCVEELEKFITNYVQRFK